MGIQDKADSILTIKGQIKTAIETKKGSSVTGAFSTYPTEITNLPSGGGNIASAYADYSAVSSATSEQAVTWMTATVPSGQTYTMESQLYDATFTGGGTMILNGRADRSSVGGGCTAEFNGFACGVAVQSAVANFNSIGAEQVAVFSGGTANLFVSAQSVEVMSGGYAVTRKSVEHMNINERGIAEMTMADPDDSAEFVSVHRAGLLTVGSGATISFGVVGSGGTLSVDSNASVKVEAIAGATVTGGGAITYLTDTTGTDAGVANVLEGKTFFSNNGRYASTGTMPTATVTETTAQAVITSGYLANGVTVTKGGGMPSLPTSWTDITGVSAYTAPSDGFLKWWISASSNSSKILMISVNGGENITLARREGSSSIFIVLGYYPLKSGDSVLFSGANFDLFNLSFGAI